MLPALLFGLEGWVNRRDTIRLNAIVAGVIPFILTRAANAYVLIMSE
jgi:hypothetical protein